MSNTNLVIFGAGASYGADDCLFRFGSNHIKKTPPLGNDLFRELQVFDPDGWGKLDPCISNKFNNNDKFEEGMGFIATFSPELMAPLQKQMSAYFFNFYPIANNLYLDFSEKIKNANWSGAIATLNYERLLELSLLRVGMVPLYGKNKQNAEEIEICYPHGCCNIFCDSVETSNVQFATNEIRISSGGSLTLREGGEINIAPLVTTSGTDIFSINNESDFQDQLKRNSLPPVISFYESEKRTISGANFIRDQKNRLKELILRAQKIAIIGVAINDNDLHIWNPLMKTDATIAYCSGPESGEEFKKWKDKNRSVPTDIIMEDYFRESLSELYEYLEIR